MSQNNNVTLRSSDYPTYEAFMRQVEMYLEMGYTMKASGGRSPVIGETIQSGVQADTVVLESPNAQEIQE